MAKKTMTDISVNKTADGKQVAGYKMTSKQPKKSSATLSTPSNVEQVVVTRRVSGLPRWLGPFRGRKFRTLVVGVVTAYFAEVGLELSNKWVLIIVGVAGLLASLVAVEDHGAKMGLPPSGGGSE